jgi:hypothetical protein
MYGNVMVKPINMYNLYGLIFMNKFLMLKTY